MSSLIHRFIPQNEEGEQENNEEGDTTKQRLWLGFKTFLLCFSTLTIILASLFSYVNGDIMASEWTGGSKVWFIILVVISMVLSIAIGIGVGSADEDDDEDDNEQLGIYEYH
jgi:hypothetical protein